MKTRHWLAWALSLVLLAALPLTVWAQKGEPTLDQIYQAANAGQVQQAQGMIDQVLGNHPDSAKAHYVKAELSARQRDGATAQQELATAERLAPGLPFAKPAAVQALRTQVQHLASAPPQDGSTRQMGGPPGPQRQAPAAAGLPWGKLAIGAAILVGLLALMRRRAGGTSGATYAGGPAAGGPYPGGVGGTGYGPGMQPPPGASYGPGYAQPGMGSGLGRGLATGLAVGAGAVAAEEIGRRMLHPNGSQVAPDPSVTGAGGWNDAGSMDNVDMGGQDFGVNDAGSWDSGGNLDAGDVGGGNDWNS